MMKKACQEIQPLLGSYALGAVEPEERKLVERHLTDCPDCQRALQEYYHVKRRILLSQPSREPPERMRRFLEEETSQERPSSTWWERLGEGWAPALRVALTAGMILLLVVNVGLFFQVRDLARTQKQYQKRFRASQTTVALLTYYDAEVVELTGETAYGTFIYEPDRELGVLNVRGLQPLPEDETYQVWLIEEDQTRESGGLFGVDDPSYDYVSHVIWSSKPLDSFKAIGVTIEPAGGSPGPTGPKVIGTDL